MTSQIQPYFMFPVFSTSCFLLFLCSSLALQLIQTFTKFLYLSCFFALIPTSPSACMGCLTVHFYPLIFHLFFNTQLIHHPLHEVLFSLLSFILPTSGGSFLLSTPEQPVFLWWSVLYSALYWFPGLLSPSLFHWAGAVFYLMLSTPAKPKCFFV